MSEYSIKIFGADPPCARCKATERVAVEASKELGLSVKVTHVSALSDEADKYDILSTPAVVINDKVVFSGRVPSKEEFKNLLIRELGIKT
ncbi:MAG: thioredoxin family protein [Candidatus Methanomethylicaceae archaeon]|nr:thioredoxin family protein [Candidatus Verstraetearchaeota archaeon]